MFLEERLTHLEAHAIGRAYRDPSQSATLRIERLEQLVFQAVNPYGHSSLYERFNTVEALWGERAPHQVAAEQEHIDIDRAPHPGAAEEEHIDMDRVPHQGSAEEEHIDIGTAPDQGAAEEENVDIDMIKFVQGIWMWNSGTDNSPNFQLWSTHVSGMLVRWTPGVGLTYQEKRGEAVFHYEITFDGLRGEQHNLGTGKKRELKFFPGAEGCSWILIVSGDERSWLPWASTTFEGQTLEFAVHGRRARVKFTSDTEGTYEDVDTGRTYEIRRVAEQGKAGQFRCERVVRFPMRFPTRPSSCKAVGDTCP